MAKSYIERVNVQDLILCIGAVAFAMWDRALGNVSRFWCNRPLHRFSIAAHVLLILLSLGSTQSASAYSFKLDRSEWVTWPGYCKARYVTTQIGKSSEYRSEVPAEAIEYWRSAIGSEAFLHIHHYCAGMIWLRRATRGSDDYPKAFMLDRAISEAQYTYRNIGPTNPMAPVVVATIAEAYLASGDDTSAESQVNELISKQPNASEPYVAGAVVYHRVGDLDRAVGLLKQGEARVEEPSAEFYYIYGLVLTDLERYSEAESYAELAYELGYPLLGLKKRLEAHNEQRR